MTTFNCCNDCILFCFVLCIVIFIGKLFHVYARTCRNNSHWLRQVLFILCWNKIKMKWNEINKAILECFNTSNFTNLSSSMLRYLMWSSTLCSCMTFWPRPASSSPFRAWYPLQPAWMEVAAPSLGPSLPPTHASWAGICSASGLLKESRHYIQLALPRVYW